VRVDPLGNAGLASEALNLQVLVNTGTIGESFDSDPALTNECSSPTECHIFTPYNSLLESFPFVPDIDARRLLSPCVDTGGGPFPSGCITAYDSRRPHHSTPINPDPSRASKAGHALREQISLANPRPLGPIWPTGHLEPQRSP
jgi:hypothetical protein